MNKKYISLFSSLFVTPLVFAQNFEGAAKPIAGLGKLIENIFQNDQSVYIISFLLFFVLLYAIFSATAKVIKPFQGDDGGINKSGKMFSVSISLLACLGIFYVTRKEGLRPFLENMLGAFGLIGAIFIGGIVYALIFYGSKDMKMFKEHKNTISLLGTFLSLLLISAITSNALIGSISALLLLIVTVQLIIALFSGGKKKEEESPARSRREEHESHHGEGHLGDLGDHEDLERGHRRDSEGSEEASARRPGRGDWPTNIPNYEKRLKRYLEGGQFYDNFEELERYEKLDRDYKIEGHIRGGDPKFLSVAILCPNGGSIKGQDSDRIAYRVAHEAAGYLYKLYTFKNEDGIRPLPLDGEINYVKKEKRLFLQPLVSIFNNHKLHEVARLSRIAVSIMTYAGGATTHIYLSGRNKELLALLEKSLKNKNFNTHIHNLRDHIAGVASGYKKRNIVNLCEDGGVQIQIPTRYLVEANYGHLRMSIRNAIDAYIAFYRYPQIEGQNKMQNMFTRLEQIEHGQTPSN